MSERAVKIQFGLFGPTIPMEAIVNAEAISYDWKKFGGWGIGYSRGEWMYNVPGDGGRAVPSREDTKAIQGSVDTSA